MCAACEPRQCSQVTSTHDDEKDEIAGHEMQLDFGPTGNTLECDDFYQSAYSKYSE
jgi:hypothetical protein